MSPRPRRGPRVIGIYRTHRERWQVRFVDADGDRGFSTYKTEEEATKGAERIRSRLRIECLTVADAVEEYQTALRKLRRRPRTIQVYASAILHLLDASRELRNVTAAYLARRVEERRSEIRESRAKEGHAKVEPRAVATDTIASELRQTKTFLRWAAKMGLVALPKLDDVKAVGERQAGKDQLTADEAQLLLDTIEPAADRGDEGAIAAAAMLLLGVRSRELLDREVRDLDQHGTMLVIWRGKTKRARRRVEVPEVLTPWLLARAHGRMPRALLFGCEDETGRWVPRSSSWLAKQVRRWCSAAGVPVVCPHGLRGTHSSLAEEAGATSHLVAAALGHAPGSRTAQRHYTTPESRATGRQRRVVAILEGGERNGPKRSPVEAEPKNSNG